MFKLMKSFDREMGLGKALQFYAAWLLGYFIFAMIFISLFGDHIPDAELQRLIQEMQETQTPPEPLIEYFVQIQNLSSILAVLFAAIIPTVMAIKKNIFRKAKFLAIILLGIGMSYINPIVGFLSFVFVAREPNMAAAASASTLKSVGPADDADRSQGGDDPEDKP